MGITVNDTVLYICIFESCAAAWIDLEMIVWSKINQRKTDTIWCHLYVESKEWYKLTLFAEQIESQTKKTNDYQRGKGIN